MNNDTLVAELSGDDNGHGSATTRRGMERRPSEVRPSIRPGPTRSPCSRTDPDAFAVEVAQAQACDSFVDQAAEELVRGAAAALLARWRDGR
ncbi:hypothetical protein [Streptomyces yanii]|uniref:hypothetical protein n=1 Tax=Streptomyces yanii TaxID=78510 RepID=UPI00337FE4CF